MCQVKPSRPAVAVIKKVVQETPTIKTFCLDSAMQARPGQFLMAWLPGLDEKPFTLTAQGRECAITVQAKGKFTERLFGMKQGGKVWIRGPYGNGFDTKGVKKACIIAGGCGSAPILMLAEELQKKKVKATIINGARTGRECLFRERLGKLAKDFYITTDDGSAGEKGFTTQVLERLFEKEKFDMVFGCGPEGMMKAVFGLCEKKKTPCQLNLERFMRCGFGICGSCALGKWLVCKDGPVFASETLRRMPGFGATALLKCGREVSIKEFADWRQK